MIRHARVWLALGLLSMGAAAAAAEVEVSSVLVKLLEQVEVPARESGALGQVHVREGQMVESGAPIAQIEDAAARFDHRRAEMEYAAARKEAANDVRVRFARKAHELAQSELRRALDSEQRFAQSVSQSEIDHLRLSVEKTALEIEQAQLESELALVAREIKHVDMESTGHAVRQRQIIAPIDGFVAEVTRRRGEWVEPGQPIARLLRLDRLRAEGLVDAGATGWRLEGCPATLTVQIDGQPVAFSGTVTFVSPEIDPVNGQVRVWAEIDNPQLTLRPGLHGSMTIDRAAP